MISRAHHDPDPRPRVIKYELRLDVENVELSALGDAQGKYHTAEIRFQVETVLPPCVLFLESRQEVQQFIDAMIEIRDAIWPEGGV